MRVFVAGATGVIGRQLVPQLVEAGHTVVGSTRSSGKAGWLENAGATPVVLDPLDRAQVMAAVLRAEPDAVIEATRPVAERLYGADELALERAHVA